MAITTTNNRIDMEVELPAETGVYAFGLGLATLILVTYILKRWY